MIMFNNKININPFQNLYKINIKNISLLHKNKISNSNLTNNINHWFIIRLTDGDGTFIVNI
jgi:hypothetical protein